MDRRRVSLPLADEQVSGTAARWDDGLGVLSESICDAKVPTNIRICKNNFVGPSTASLFTTVGTHIDDGPGGPSTRGGLESCVLCRSGRGMHSPPPNKNIRGESPASPASLRVRAPRQVRGVWTPGRLTAPA